MEIWYHGTNINVYKKILKEGFKKRTFFTNWMDTAIDQGGPYVFAVLFKDKPTTYWEYVSPRKIPESRILWLRFFPYEQLYYSKDNENIQRYAMLKEDNPGKKICRNCKGRGQTEEYPAHLGWKERPTCTTCKECKGKGVI